MNWQDNKSTDEHVKMLNLADVLTNGVKVALRALANSALPNTWKRETLHGLRDMIGILLDKTPKSD